MLQTLHRVTNYLETITEPIAEPLICPITMKPILIVAIDSYGISYERDAINQFITKYGVSPMSDKPMTIDQLETSSMIQKIEWQKQSAVLNTEIKRYRLILTVMCFVNFKFTSMDQSSLEMIKQKLLEVSYDVPSDWWPAMHDRAMVFDIVWKAFAELRSMAYGEFNRIQNPGNIHSAQLTDFTRGKARQFFKSAAIKSFFSTKSELINMAIETFVKYLYWNTATGRHERYETYENIQNRNERTIRWTEFFNEKRHPPPTPTTIPQSDHSSTHTTSTFPRRSDGMSEAIWYMYGCPQGGHYC